MAKVFITLTGTKHYFGNDFLEKGTKIRLEKEPDNEYDKEAIKVTYEGLGKIGYVANSSYTVIGESMSAGRLYDKIGDALHMQGWYWSHRPGQSVKFVKRAWHIMIDRSSNVNSWCFYTTA